ncbi:MAG: OB-fold nucleic acid binding domain-containing protein [archaeon]|nr:OB-fold nucleic acid binding domain-containing protein [archaeon]
MDEKSLQKLAMITTIVGLLILFFYAQEVNLNVVNQIDDLPSSENVRIQGVITKLTQKEKVYFLTVEGQKPEIMDVILFPDKEIYLKEGSFVDVSGTVEEYNGKKEVIAEEIVMR